MTKPELKSVDEVQSEVVLSEEQRRGLDEADRWAVEAMTQLGTAHLRHEESKRHFAATESQLAECERAAKHAERQRARIMKVLASMLKLPPGEWTYDAKKGKLTREG